MVTGIDETGDFDPNSDKFNYFIGISLDQNENRLSIKKSQYDIWEGSIPEKYKSDKGEVKGKLLPEEYLDTFSDTVLEVKPTILYSVVRIKPSENPPEILEKHKKVEIQQLEKIIEKTKRLGHHNWASRYEEILIWYRTKNYQTIMKMKCLESLIGISLNNVLGWSQISYLSDNDISNIRDIRIVIDKDFVRAENVRALWNESFRQFWRDFTFDNRIPIIKDLGKEDHPIYKVYGSEGKLNFSRIFRKGTQFLDSKDSWEIRMADISGTILHRYQNRGKCERAGKKLLSHLGLRQKNYEDIILNDVR
jgi:Protein of unknown function (DUF3800)